MGNGHRAGGERLVGSTIVARRGLSSFDRYRLPVERFSYPADSVACALVSAGAEHIIDSLGRATRCQEVEHAIVI